MSLDVVALQGLGNLQQVDVPIIDQSACQNMFQIQATEQVNIRYDMLCAGFKDGGKDSCQVSVCACSVGCPKSKKPNKYMYLI